MPDIGNSNILTRNSVAVLPSMKTVVNNGMPQSLSTVRRNLTRSESTQNKIANMLPVTQPQAYEVVVPKQLKKPLVVNR